MISGNMWPLPLHMSMRELRQLAKMEPNVKVLVYMHTVVMTTLD